MTRRNALLLQPDRRSQVICRCVIAVTLLIATPLLGARAASDGLPIIVNGVSRIGYMSGGHTARWVDEDMADVITRKAAGVIETGNDESAQLRELGMDLGERHNGAAAHPEPVQAMLGRLEALRAAGRSRPNN